MFIFSDIRIDLRILGLLGGHRAPTHPTVIKSTDLNPLTLLIHTPNISHIRPRQGPDLGTP